MEDVHIVATINGHTIDNVVMGVRVMYRRASNAPSGLGRDWRGADTGFNVGELS